MEIYRLISVFGIKKFENANNIITSKIPALKDNFFLENDIKSLVKQRDKFDRALNRDHGSEKPKKDNSLKSNNSHGNHMRKEEPVKEKHTQPKKEDSKNDNGWLLRNYFLLIFVV